jgi:OmpA-OmpF porin, OOP family
MKTNPSILLVLPCMIYSFSLNAQVKTVSSDKEWEQQQSVVTNSIEADYIIRIGDVDNLNFGWPEGFDPFCGRMTETHNYPWAPIDSDLPGFDRILMSSHFKPERPAPCGGDGYSGSYDPITSKPVTWKISTDALKDVPIQNAYIQIFIDDFQSTLFCSKFQMVFNGKRFIEGERVLSAIDQTGPVGKLVSIPLNEEHYSMLSAGTGISLLIDESSGSADGFAMDFVRILVNRKRSNSCKGDIRGRVLEKNTETPIANATVYTADKKYGKTNSKGEFEMLGIPTGFEVLSASASGYADGYSTADIGEGNENTEVVIYLIPGKVTKFDNKQLKVGESITLNNILFDQGQAVIKNESKPDLDKVVTFLKTNQSIQIELSGHTSSEGDRDMNRSLSYKRVKACREYIVSAGIAEERLVAVGYGPDRPIASNDTPLGRTLNRRVEMRITSL